MEAILADALHPCGAGPGCRSSWNKEKLSKVRQASVTITDRVTRKCGCQGFVKFLRNLVYALPFCLPGTVLGVAAVSSINNTSWYK